MRVLLTGGSGDLGLLLARDLAQRGDVPVCLDLRPPRVQRGEFVQGSITDRALLAQILPGIDVVVHIAAWHGIHEVTGQRDAFDFWDVNVTGTFNVLETAVRANITKFVYISSTSVEERFGVYGHTKVLGEEIAQTYVVRHGVNLIALRPRAFIPHWNTDTYKNYLEWTNWFWGGAVHIDDVAQATLLTVDRLVQNPPKNYLCLTVDGAYDYSPDVLANWDADGPGSSFAKQYPNFVALAEKYGLPVAKRPSLKNITQTVQELGYQPRFSLQNLLEELAKFGSAGPPPPLF
ncbi:MAG: NAD(P)-dependent oxidoreductase [Anaerolineales bacterium]|nr:NAD(P)-dependent oxidoreductase [Anaerolineales bacterium]MCB8937860.1 NAD(P)-dependent oxidoreductase [Ardenticatenaceae bacterium]